jgi:hypothetical protein
VLHREVISLTRISKDGQILRRYRAPWYLAWGTMPVPAGLGIVATFVLGIIDMIKRRRRASAAKRRRTKDRVGREDSPLPTATPDRR